MTILSVIKNDKIIQRFYTGNGLKSNNIKSIAEKDGKIWVNTDETLQIIDLKTGIITNLLDEYGLAGLAVALRRQSLGLGAKALDQVVNDLIDFFCIILS